jgi:long-chain-fatty-acid--CoA ligase ACSBG
MYLCLNSCFYFGSTHAKALINTSRFVGKQFAQNKQFGGDGRLPCGYALADYFVFSRLRKHLGLEECRACFSAAAPLAVEVQQYFASMGIPVYEVYGQSECTGPHAMNKDGAWKIGTCGIPLKGVETKICPATGEICIRGRHVFMGYMYMPEKTEEVISFDGWMMTGDEGVLEVKSGFEQHPSLQGGSETFLRVTGRIKELIITAGGENIPPVLIENEMKGVMPALSHCIVIGEKLPYLTMLLTLKVELDPETFLPTKTLASDALNVSKKIGSKATTVDECMNDVAWQGYFERGRVCANHKAASNTQRVRKFALLPVDFSERGGELTPTLKMKRHVIEKQYEEVIDNMYAIHLDPTPDSRPKLERPDIA